MNALIEARLSLALAVWTAVGVFACLNLCLGLYQSLRAEWPAAPDPPRVEYRTLHEPVLNLPIAVPAEGGES